MPAECRLRHGRRSIAGQIFLVTFTTHRRKPLFADASLAMAASRLLAESSAWTGADLLAWVLMPDHWHGVVALRQAELSDVVGKLKGRSARLLRRELAVPDRIWGRGFHDRALRKEDDLVAMARYVVLNPVRAGLVGSVREYPFWDAAWVGDGRARG